MNRQKVFNLALKTFLFLSPVFVFKDYKLSFSRGLFFVLGTFALFGISLGCEQRRKFSNIWVSLFLLLAFIRMFFDNGIGNPQTEWFNFWMACAGFIYVFCGILLFYIVYCYVGKVEEYFKPIAWVCVLNFILVLAQIFKHDFMWTHTPSICGFMETSSQVGQYSALALPILMYLNPFLTIIPLLTLFASKSISPILAGVAGMVVFCVLYRVKRVFIVGIAILLILIGLLNFGYIKMKFQCRPVMWQKTLKVALQRPYFGWGYGSFADKITEQKEKSYIGGNEYLRAHNDYLHTFQELGAPIVICIAMFFIGLFKKFKSAVKDKLTLCLATSVIIVLINMSGQTLIRYASVAEAFIILLSLLCIKIEGGKDANSNTL